MIKKQIYNFGIKKERKRERESWSLKLSSFSMILLLDRTHSTWLGFVKPLSDFQDSTQDHIKDIKLCHSADKLSF